MAMAENSATVERMRRSSSAKTPSPSPLTSSMTPRVSPLKVSGTQRIDAVWKREAVSKRLAKRGSLATSGTSSGRLFCATQPAMPSPALMRRPSSVSEPAPTAAWK